VAAVNAFVPLTFLSPHKGSVWRGWFEWLFFDVVFGKIKRALRLAVKLSVEKFWELREIVSL
jgi:hypothetical protein